MRIGLVGSAGTGKSSLGKALAARLDVPFLAAKTITQSILERDGYDYGSGIQIERFLSNGGRQKEMLRRTVGEQKSHDEFVTDRTVIDLAAYAIVELHGCDAQMVNRIYASCKRHVRRYTHLFFCPWSSAPMKGNRRRTLNPWYQFVVGGAELGVMSQWSVSFHELTTIREEDRVDEIMAVIDDSA